MIDTTPDTCTSLIINRYLNGAERVWAVVGAYGDNFFESAQRAAEPLNLTQAQHKLLKEFGTCLNYNGYGFTLDDLIYHPADLYRLIRPYSDPLEFIAEEMAHIDDALREIAEKTGVTEILNLPAEKMFKIKVDFEV